MANLTLLEEIGLFDSGFCLAQNGEKHDCTVEQFVSHRFPHCPLVRLQSYPLSSDCSSSTLHAAEAELANRDVRLSYLTELFQAGLNPRLLRPHEPRTTHASQLRNHDQQDCSAIH